jgi:hypothetical protein
MNGENNYSYYLEKFHEAKNDLIQINNTNILNEYLIEKENREKNKIYTKEYYNYYNIFKFLCCFYRK